MEGDELALAVNERFRQIDPKQSFLHFDRLKLQNI
jgi:hypothetical protein